MAELKDDEWTTCMHRTNWPLKTKDPSIIKMCFNGAAFHLKRLERFSRKHLTRIHGVDLVQWLLL
jgi:hypothetical protein